MIKLSKKKVENYTGDMVVFLVRKTADRAPSCVTHATQAVVDRAFAIGDFAGEEGKYLMYYPEKGDSLQARRVLVVGLGDGILSREMFRKAGGTVAAAALKTGTKEIFVQVPDGLDFEVNEMVECLTEGLLLGAYQFRKYKRAGVDEENQPGKIEAIELGAGDRSAADRGLRKGRVAAMAACAVRDMANEPGNVWTPSSFAEFGRALSSAAGLTCGILGRREMKKLGMGGILGVNSGSALSPVLVTLEYRASKKSPTLLMVGKGLTFDSGGISIKPAKGMEDMKYDMCGGAAVLAAMQAVAAERPKGLNVVAIVPATENLPSPAALKPGDIITIYGGRTVEVVNTDAEGRLILADALAYGVAKYKPAAVIDLATLTGAVVIALGHHRAGLFANDDRLAARIIEAGDRCGEPLWRLPLGKEYSRQLKSEVADIRNVSNNRAAGSITGAAFLQEFVGSTPWAHLDIAGTAYGFTEKTYMPKGPSGIGARTLLEVIRNWK